MFDNVVHTTLENDDLVGRIGAGNLIGRTGKDVLRGKRGKDRRDGGEGIDTVRYIHAPQGVTVQIALPGYGFGRAANRTFLTFDP